MKKAFTLIEFSIYLVLLSMLTLTIFGFLSHVYNNVFEENKRHENHIQILTALDVLRRDMWSASSELKCWDINSFVFRQFKITKRKTVEARDIGWELKDKKLRRLYGSYDYTKHL